MSRWTHIIACLAVNTCMKDKQVTKKVKDYLERAPKITGSEEDADVFVNLQDGYNIWTNRDCKQCEYKDTFKHLKEGGFQCGADEEYECPEGKYQSCVTITIQGDLRDKDGETTKKEFIEFYNYIKEKWHIDLTAITIYDEYVGLIEIKEIPRRGEY